MKLIDFALKLLWMVRPSTVLAKVQPQLSINETKPWAGPWMFGKVPSIERVSQKVLYLCSDLISIRRVSQRLR